MPIPVPANIIGLTAVSDYSTFSTSPSMRDQLDAAGIAYETVQLPAIAGMGGNALLLNYTSPNTQQPVTVLVVPDQTEVDQFGETYYYFEQLPLNDAMAGDVPTRWADLYHRARALARDAGRTWLPYSRALTYPDVVLGMVVVESHNGVRNRITEIDGEMVTVTPIDNPKPIPRREPFRGRTPISRYIGNLCDTHLLLTNQMIADLDTAAYAELLSLGNSKIEWLPYDPTAHAEQAN